MELAPPPLGAGVLSGDEEEEEEESEGEDLIPPPVKALGSRSSVSAEAFGAWNQRGHFQPPVYEKTPDQIAWLIAILPRSFLFHSLEPKDLQVVALAMRGPIVLEPGVRLINEGQSGDHLYVVQDGTLQCAKMINGMETVVQNCVQGDLFGELALLYNCPRAASVISYSASIVWELDRETFNNIVMDSVQRKRTVYTDVLKRVPVFSKMSEGDMANIIDVLKLEIYASGSVIVRQGEQGNHFFIVLEGEVLASKESLDSPSPICMTHGAGDYFGELALMQNTPRAATVVACSPEVKVLSMDRSTFKRLMGRFDDVLRGGLARYES